MKPLTYTGFVLHTIGLMVCIGVTTWIAQKVGLEPTIAPAVAAGVYILGLMRDRK